MKTGKGVRKTINSRIMMIPGTVEKIAVDFTEAGNWGKGGEIWRKENFKNGKCT